MGLVIVAYDLSCDTQRRRLHAALGKVAEGVQQSVFSGRLGERGLRVVDDALGRWVRSGDRAVVVTLCEGCAGRVRWVGGMLRGGDAE